MTERTPFFSVIIPIYNVEPYLRECVDHVLAQSFRDLEVILVDDGSPDGCGGICDAYAQADPRVRVIHKPNGGLSDARNAGLRIAVGTYVLFLDSDDYWGDLSALERCHRELTEADCTADLLIFQAKLFYPDGTVLPDNWDYPANFNSLTSREALRYMVSHGILPGSAWVNAIRRSYLLEHELFFVVGIKSEDIEWLKRLHNHMPRYQYTDQAFYMYRKGRAGSITGSTSMDYLDQFREILSGFLTYHYRDPQAEEALKGYAAYQFTILMAKVGLLPANQRKIMYQKLLPMRELLKYDLHPKVRTVNKAVRLLGFGNACRLLNFYLKYRKR